jgi:SAM-dependent methyltransferase
MTQLTDNEYWTEFWHANVRHQPIDLNSYEYSEIFGLFKRVRDRIGIDRVKILEVGCGNTAWLPFLEKTFGWEVVGIDNNEYVLKITTEIFHQERIKGELLQRDLFEDNADLVHRFDVVYSGGLVEHFGDLDVITGRIARFVNKGGYIVTTVPNLMNCAVLVQRIVGPNTLKAHKVVKLENLIASHERLYFKTIYAGYLGFGVSLVPDRSTHMRRLLIAATSKIFAAARAGTRMLSGHIPRSRATASALAYVGQLSNHS